MPSTSKKQHNFMAAIAHNSAFAKRVGIPQKVGKHFLGTDKGKKFGTGGSMKRKHKFAVGGLAMDPMGNPIMVGSQGIPNQMGRPMRPPGMGGNPMMNYRKGGHVKPSKMEGKAKETKSIAHEEMKALKRGHAPKKILEHERAEHKAMGYKRGGMAKGGMKRHAAPRQHKGVDPAMLAAMLGPAGGMGGAGAGPMAAGPGAMPDMGGGTPPGMGAKKGGKVHHHSGHGGVHHHHHYTKGGKIETPFKKPEVEKIIGNKKRANPDGAEKKGHTKGKMVKMASGGHVRGHGIESKGKTRGKYC